MTSLQLHNADCLIQMKSIPDKSIDLIICDLPYGCLIGGGNRKNKILKSVNGVLTDKTIEAGYTEGCEWDIKLDLDLFWKEIKRIRKNDHTPTLHFCSTKFGVELINSNPKEFRYDLVWVKSNAVGFLSANKKPMAAHEMIYVFSKLGSNYNRIDILGDFKKNCCPTRTINFIRTNIKKIVNDNTGTRCVKSTIEISNTKEKDAHPTAKPVELYKWLIERYSNPGDMVLDPTAGSFRSGVVSKELGRSYIGIEMNKAFYDKGNALFAPLN